MGVRVSRTVQLSVIKTLPCMKKTLLNSNRVPLDAVGCPVRRPFRASRFPFFGDLK